MIPDPYNFPLGAQERTLNRSSICYPSSFNFPTLPPLGPLLDPEHSDHNDIPCNRYTGIVPSQRSRMEWFRSYSWCHTVLVSPVKNHQSGWGLTEWQSQCLSTFLAILSLNEDILSIFVAEPMWSKNWNCEVFYFGNAGWCCVNVVGD